MALRTLSVNIYEGEPNEGGYWAEVPELPGCVAQGETISEVQANVIDAIDVWLETAREVDDTEARRPALRATFSVLVDEDRLIPAQSVHAIATARLTCRHLPHSLDLTERRTRF